MGKSGSDPQAVEPLLMVLVCVALASSLLSEYPGLLGSPSWTGPAMALATALTAVGVLWRRRITRGLYVFLFMSAQAGAALAGTVLGF
jgi:hypothetical protein